MSPVSVLRPDGSYSVIRGPAVTPGPPPPFDRFSLRLVPGSDLYWQEPTYATVGTIPNVPRTTIEANTTINGQGYYVLSAGQTYQDVTFNCRVRGANAARIINGSILGWPTANPTGSDDWGLLDLTTLSSGSGNNMYLESVDFDPAPENRQTTNTGIRGAGVKGYFCHFAHNVDGMMVYGNHGDGAIRMHASWAEKPWSSWPADDPVRGDGDASHSDCFIQVEGGSIYAYGCKTSAIYRDPATDLPYYDGSLPEWGGRYLPNTNGAGFSAILSSGNFSTPVDVVYENGWIEGAKIPIYIVHAATLPSGRISFAGTKIRKGLLGVPYSTSPRYHIIKAGAGVALDLTGTVACSDDLTSWTPSGSLVISNAG